MPVNGNTVRGRSLRMPGRVTGNFVLVESPYSVAANFYNIQYAITSVTYSESNMRAAFAGGGADRTAIAIVPKSLGKWVFEATLLGGSSTLVIGIADMSVLGVASVAIGDAATTYGYIANGQKISLAGGGAAYGATYTTNDVISILFDFDAGELSFAKNGSSQGVAFSGLSGTIIPALGQRANNSADWRISTTLTYSFPGFLQWR